MAIATLLSHGRPCSVDQGLQLRSRAADTQFLESRVCSLREKVTGGERSRKPDTSSSWLRLSFSGPEEREPTRVT
jgi:hypothetical protein